MEAGKRIPRKRLRLRRSLEGASQATSYRGPWSLIYYQANVEQADAIGGGGRKHLLSADGKYRMWCFNSISEGKWLLRGGDKIVVRPDPKKSDEEIITLLSVERYADRPFRYVRYQDGSREKWMK